MNDVFLKNLVMCVNIKNLGKRASPGAFGENRLIIQNDGHRMIEFENIPLLTLYQHVFIITDPKKKNGC